MSDYSFLVAQCLSILPKAPTRLIGCFVTGSTGIGGRALGVAWELEVAGVGSWGSVTIPVYGRRRERRQAHRDVLGPVGPRRAVTHPLARARHHGLARRHFERAPLVLHAERPFQHDRDLLELR